MTFAQWQGYCPLCRTATTFRSEYDWFRDHLTCVSCPGGSCPRERAIMLVLERTVPDWRKASIHESSPIGRGVSLVLRSECPGYVASQFYPGVEPGSEHAGFRCEDLERQTFADGSFDVVVTQDVMEHVFDPASAYREIHRTLKRGGVHVHTTPIYKDKLVSERRAELRNGQVVHLVEPPEYHENPVDRSGALVTFHYGHDLPDLIQRWAGLDVEVIRFNDRFHGVVGEFTEVVVCHKR